MKTLMIILALALTSTGAMAQKKKKEVKEIIIQTSAVCEMCKTTIEEGLVYVKGVRESNLNVASAKVTIKYRSDKTTPEKLRAAITKLGYMADDIAPTITDYNNLHGCCKDPSVKPVAGK